MLLFINQDGFSVTGAHGVKGYMNQLIISCYQP
ncbi:Uncharacterised protein [Shigella sonnei]|nr:Uncharacterised protein [Shigella sonnei]